jgi:hypothetical protein
MQVQPESPVVLGSQALASPTLALVLAPVLTS